MRRILQAWRISVSAVTMTLLSAACAIQDTTAPPLQGPSELSLSLTLSAIPDVLSLDGSSQAQIQVYARDANGQPARSVTFRADILTAAGLVDCGSLSARTLVTGTDGRASLIYTAPRFACDTSGAVSIRVIPFGTDAANSVSRTVDIRLLPPGTIDPGGPRPSFTVNGSSTPGTLTPFADITFDGSASTAAPGTALVSFAWAFGDGGTATGTVALHRFSPGTFTVRLTVTDTNGVAVPLSKTITVGAGTLPTAAFVFSPTAPVLNQPIVFNAGSSRPATGRTLVRYDWNFGSGSPGSGIVVTKSYDVPGTYNVQLTVTDDAGQTNTVTNQVLVNDIVAGAPTARFTINPSPANTGQVVTFDASASTTPGGATIVRYEWNFDDGSAITSTYAPVATIQHIFTQQSPNVINGYTIRLTVFDSYGRSATTTQQLKVY